MAQSDMPDWLAQAAEEINRQANRSDGAQVAGCLTNGLTILRESLYVRVHQDVETVVGKDSMIVPASEVKAKQGAVEQIEAYQIAESASAAAQYGYVVDVADGWYIPWLAQLRLGQPGADPDILERSKSYLAQKPEKRRLAFGDILGRVLPASRRAPLVLFRLVPLAIQINTACAFGDRDTAADLRHQQVGILPAITDCRQCRGRLLECIEQCRTCGNPLWKYQWLTAAD